MMRTSIRSAVCVLVAFSISYSVAEDAQFVRGVPLNDQARFHDEFSCLVNGQRQHLNFARVNDDFCDCDDGSDEPGTAACSHHEMASFHCTNGGYFPHNIHTSRVNDGVCDCCDGLDEYTTINANCPNTCAQDAKVYREKAEARLEDVLKGYEERQKVLQNKIASYFSGMEATESATEELLSSLEHLKHTVQWYKEKEERKEEMMRIEKARIDQTNGAQADKRVCEAGQDDESCQNPLDDSNLAMDETDEDLELLQAANTDQKISTEDHAPVEESTRHIRTLVDMSDGTRVSLGEYINIASHPKRKRPKSIEEMKREDFLGPLFNGGPEGRKRFGLYALRALGLMVAPVRGVVDLVLFVPRLIADGLAETAIVSYLPTYKPLYQQMWFRRLADGQVYEAYAGFSWSCRVVWDAPIFFYRYLFPTVDYSVTTPEAESLRNILKEVENDITKVKLEKEEKRKAMNQDYGPDRAFFDWKDTCFEKQIEKYKYKFCGFKDIRQDKLSIGKWDRWGAPKQNEDGSVDYTRMQFANGQKCWNGPKRSVDVHLECGGENEIKRVDEPATCAYEMTVATPLMCTEEKVVEARTALAFWT